MASFLYCFPYSYCSCNYCDSNSCRSFTLLKALAKSNGNLFAISFKSEKRTTTIAIAKVGRAITLEGERKVTVIFLLSPLTTIAIVGRAITLERVPSKKKQRTDTKKDAKRIRLKTLQVAIEKN